VAGRCRTSCFSGGQTHPTSPLPRFRALQKWPSAARNGTLLPVLPQTFPHPTYPHTCWPVTAVLVMGPPGQW